MKRGIGHAPPYPELSPMIGGDGLFSFNYKLAVLVSEADGQITKVRHARLILVNLPPAHLTVLSASV